MVPDPVLSVSVLCSYLALFPFCYLNKFTKAAPVLGWLSNGAFPGAAAMAAAEAGPCDAAGESRLGAALGKT